MVLLAFAFPEAEGVELKLQSIVIVFVCATIENDAKNKVMKSNFLVMIKILKFVFISKILTQDLHTN